MRHSGESSQGFFLKFSSPNFCRDFLFDMTKSSTTDSHNCLQLKAFGDFHQMIFTSVAYLISNAT